MCGILGLVSRNASVPAETLKTATDSLFHRGPDDAGTVIVRETGPEPIEIGLGNRRLAILDLSPLGHQPMHDPETGNWIVYNGEVYNFRDLRRRLEGEGATFRSQSDTEVVLKAYGHWGEHCLEQLRGIFAFAIWDARHHRLLLARDGMGVKPLYYCHSRDYFLFASEVRALLKTGMVPAKLDPAGLLNYLRFGSAYEPNSLVQNLSALRAGHFLCWEHGAIREQRYWDLAGSVADPGSESFIRPRREQEEELQACIRESVRMQTVSDVPVGVFLSGGIDSGAVAAILSHSAANISTFSVELRESEYSESEYSRRLAKKLGTDHHEILISAEDALAALPDALRAMDQPSMDGLNTYLLSKQVRAAGIKVALSGLGGDELFAGYSTFRNVPRMEQFVSLWRRVPYEIHGPTASLIRFFTSGSDRNRKLAALAASNGDLLHPYFLARSLFTPQQRNQLCHLQDPALQQAAEEPLRDCVARAWAFDPINRVSYLESRCYMLNTLLRDADAMSMAHGLELRVPLVDPVLAAKAFSIAGSWKMDEHTPKPLLVGAVENGLPDEIVYRRKRGFTLPFDRWMQGELRPAIEQTLRRVCDGSLASVLNAGSVWAVWQDFLRGRTSSSRPWSLYVLQQWCELQGIAA